MDSSLPSSSFHGILQARILEWIAISFSRESSWYRDRTHVLCLQIDSLPLNHQGNPWNTRDVQKFRKRSEILVVAPLHRRGHPHAFFPGVPLCLASILTNRFSVCSPTCCTMSLKINFLPSFTILPPWEMHFLLGDKYIYIYTHTHTHIYILMAASNPHLSYQFLNYGVHTF